MGYTGSADGAAQPPDGGEPARPGSRPARRPLWNRAGLQPGGTALPPLESLYRAHYTALVRLAALLTGDAVLAESVAADSMAALLSGSLGIRPPEPHLFWLRRQVVVRSRRAARGRPAGTGPADTGDGGSGTRGPAPARPPVPGPAATGRARRPPRPARSGARPRSSACSYHCPPASARRSCSGTIWSSATRRRRRSWARACGPYGGTWTLPGWRSRQSCRPPARRDQAAVSTVTSAAGMRLLREPDHDKASLRPRPSRAARSGQTQLGNR